MSPLDPTADFVQFPDDSGYAGKLVGYVQTTVNGGEGDTLVYLPVTVLTDDQGNILDVARLLGDGAEMTAMLLRAMLLRLDLLIGAVDKTYTPPDELPYSEE